MFIATSCIRKQLFAAAVTGSFLLVSNLAPPALAQDTAPSVLDGLMVDVIVTLDEFYAPGGHSANEAAAEAISQSFGLTASNTYGTVLFGFSASVPVGRLTAFENDPRVLSVELVHTVTALAPVDCSLPENADHKKCQGGGGGGGKPGGGGGGTPPSQTTSWGYDRIGMEWVTTVTGSGVHVYVFDSGIDFDHPDLEENISLDDNYAVDAVAAVCRGRNSCPVWHDDFHHGTQVAGIIGAVDNTEGVVGVAPDVILHAYKVLNKSGSGADSGVIDAIDWLAHLIDETRSSDPDHGHPPVYPPVVANMSFTTSNVAAIGTCAGFEFKSGDGSLYSAYHQAFCELALRGVIIVTGAGNGGVSLDNVAKTYVPAAYDDSVITVTATNDFDEWSSLSNYGNVVAIAAPGENILTTTNDGGYTENSGSSFAAPHVAGAIALWIQKNRINEVSCTNYACFTDALFDIEFSAEPIPDDDNGTPQDPDDDHTEDLLRVDFLINSE